MKQQIIITVIAETLNKGKDAMSVAGDVQSHYRLSFRNKLNLRINRLTSFIL